MSEPHDLIDSVLNRLKAEVDAEFVLLAERHNQALTAARQGLLDGFGQIDAAKSITDALTAILRAAAREAPRAALFVGGADTLEQWTPVGAPSMSDREHAVVAIPLLLDGEQVAVLYGHDDEGTGVEGWRDGLAVIASHGASRLASITATRTAQAMRWLSPGRTSFEEAALKGWTAPATPATEAALKGWTTATAGSVTTAGSAMSHAPPSSDEEEQAARRYARLLVSEIKLYNELTVRTGREHRDLSRRLAPDIDRARHLYEQRVPARLPGRTALFDNELVQTLAGGDGSLLG